jgi:CHAT domain-containing protein/tetratricopeptide (TPR) repeat protein
MEEKSNSNPSAERGLWATLREWRHRRSTVDWPDVWKGTGFRVVQEGVERDARGLDGEAARQRGAQAFAEAREADRITEHRLAISYLQLALALFIKAGSDELAYVIANIARQYRILGDTPISIRLHRLSLVQKLIEGADIDSLLNTAIPLGTELQRSGDYLAAIDILDRMSELAASRGQAIPATVQGQRERLDQIHRLAQALRAPATLISPSAPEFDCDLAQILTLFRTGSEADLNARFEFHCRLAHALYGEPVCMFAESVDQYRAALALSRVGSDRQTHLRTLGAAAGAAAELGDLTSQAEFLEELLAVMGDEGIFSDESVAQRMQYVLMLLRAEDQPTARKHIDVILSDAALHNAAYAEAIVSQASVLQRQGYHDIANRCFDAVIEANASTVATAAARIRLAKTMVTTGQPLPALELLQQNLELVSRLDGELATMSWFGVAQALLRLGDVEGATEAFEQLQRAAEDVFDPAIEDRMEEVAAELAYQAMAMSNSQDVIIAALTQPDAAKSETGQKAIMALRVRLRDINSDSNSAHAALLRASLVSVLLGAGQFSGAKAEAKAALRACRVSGRRDLYGSVLHELGVLSAMTDRLESAERIFSSAVCCKDKYGGSESRWTSLANLSRARNLLGRVSPPDEVGEVVEHLHELPSGERMAVLLQFALSHEQKSPRVADEAALRFFAESGTAEPELEVSARRLQARLALGRKNLPDARRATLEALSVAEGARRQASASSRKHFDAMIDRTVGFAMDLAWRSDPPQCLALAERMKLRALLEQFGLWGVHTPSDFPEPLRARESELLAALRYEERSALFPNDRAAMVTLGLAPLATEQQLTEFWLTLPEEWQDYGRLRAGSPATLEQLGALIRDRHPCHHVVMTPTAESVYIFQLSPQGELIGSDRYTVSRSSLANLVIEYNEALSHRADPDREVAAALTDLLTRAISPVPAGAALAIVPSGPLMHLAYPSTTVGHDLLVKRNSVAVLPSLTLLNYLRSEAVTAADSVAVYGDSLSDLPATRTEATWVAKRFGTDATLGARVTRASALAGFPRARIVHVAGHAEYRAASVDQAGFVLADRTILSGRDLLDSTIGAELAFLSGCDTGRFAVGYGDELTGLPVGFIRSGVPCISAAAWPVNDESTRFLVKEFYRAAQPGATYAAALRAAQLELLVDSRRKHPYHWAAFQLWGCATVAPA